MNDSIADETGGGLTVEELVKQSTSLVTTPEVSIRVVELLGDPDSSSADLCALIESDPALSATVLRVANSSALGASREVDSVQSAVTRLGSARVQEIALSQDVASAFDDLPETLVSVKDFWLHSIRCAVASAAVAEKCGGTSVSLAFTTGLLHDIGELILFAEAPQQAEAFLIASLEEQDGLSTFPYEQRILGFDHTDVGYALACEWGLPEHIAQAIRGHHEPAKLNPPSDLAHIVHIGNTLAVMVELRSNDFEDAPAICSEALSRLGLELGDLQGLLPRINADADQTVALFNVNH